ncbi:retrovirus-related pol polyprotein from transposon TNT 1-94 [Tanacetum coccineum]
MDPNSSVGKTCLGENIIEISSEKAKDHGDWNSSKYEDTTNSGGKKEMKALIFHKMDTEEISDIYVAPCFVNGLEAYDGEINLGTEENMISNELAMKLCLEHEVKCRHKVVKKELIIALRGEIYFVKFTINPEEDDVEQGELDPFLDSSGEEEKIGDDWDLLLDDLNFRDIPNIEGEERPVIETMTYTDKYKKILDGIYIDKMKLDGEMNKEEEEAITRIKGEALIKKEDPRAFVIPIRMEGKINLNALADTGSDINVMPYRVYKELGREQVTDVKRGITMLNHSKAEPMGVSEGCLMPAKTSLDTTESDSDDEEEYAIQRNKFGAPIYGPKPA